MAKGAQDEAFLHGYTVLFGSTDNNYIQEEKFLDALKAKMVDGIIYVSFNPATSEKLLENITVPVVFMDRKIKKRSIGWIQFLRNIRWTKRFRSSIRLSFPEE